MSRDNADTEVELELDHLNIPRMPVPHHGDPMAVNASGEPRGDLPSAERVISRVSSASTVGWTQEVSGDGRSMVKRRLRPIHIFMITLNATLGVGLYWRGGLILRTGGILAVLLSFFLVGILAWAVMQCIVEFLCIWPIAGALGVYVGEFVDKELGIAVGITYWFTYAISFAALISTTFQEVQYWNANKGLDSGILFIVVPIFLAIINCFGVEVYGDFEVIFGVIKICFFFVVLVVLIIANRADQASLRILGVESANPGSAIVFSQLPNQAGVYNSASMNSYAGAFFSSLSFAAFAYVGVEVVAACALEARVPRNSSVRKKMPGRTIKFAAIWFPFVATVMYVLAGLLVSIDLPWDLSSLPTSQISQAQPSSPLDRRGSMISSALTDQCSTTKTSSAFVLATSLLQNEVLTSVVNVFLIFTALTCANSNLFIASRALFSLTRFLRVGDSPTPLMRALRWIGETNARGVPLRAVAVSCIVFVWVPWLSFAAQDCNGNSTAETIVDVLGEMGSIGVLIVWACECWAFIRFKNCLDDANVPAALRDVPLVQRWDRRTTENYPYRSHGQPLVAYSAFAGCLIILVIANGAPLWKVFTTGYFFGAYLAPICFLVLWAALKLAHRRSQWPRTWHELKGMWKLVDLTNGEFVKAKIEKLHEKCATSTAVEDDSKTGGLFGLL